MGLFAKINEASRPGDTKDRPPLPADSTANRITDPVTDHPDQGGLFLRAQAFTDRKSDTTRTPRSAEKAIHDACHDRLERVSPGDCDTALSILKSFYPLDTILFIRAPFETPQLYASCGVELGHTVQKGLEEQLAKALPALLHAKNTPLPLVLPREKVPQALSLHQSERIFVLAVGNGQEAIALLTKNEGDDIIDDMARLLGGSLANRFLPPVNFRSQGAVATQKSTPGGTNRISDLFETGESVKDVLLLEHIEQSKETSALIAQALPMEFTLRRLGEQSLVIAAPPSFDLELVWHHLLAGPLSRTAAKQARVHFMPSLDKARLATALGKRGYGNSPH